MAAGYAERIASEVMTKAWSETQADFYTAEQVAALVAEGAERGYALGMGAAAT